MPINPNLNVINKSDFEIFNVRSLKYNIGNIIAVANPILKKVMTTGVKVLPPSLPAINAPANNIVEKTIIR